MVLVTLTDSSSSVTLPSGAVTGPVTFWADEVTKDATEYSDGVLLVQGSAVHHTSQIGPIHAFAWPYVLVLLLALSWITARRS